MENARVVVLEDKTELYEVIEKVLEDAGHEITAVADSIETALETLRQIRDNEIECDVVVLDGNLRDGMTCGSHASELMEYIEKYELNVKVIGFSGSPMSEYDISVDGEVRGKRIHDLPRAIGSLILSEERNEQPAVYASHLGQSARATG